MKKRRNKFLANPQNIITIALAIISICALIVSILQTRIMAEERQLIHQQAKVSVWPQLKLDLSVGNEFDTKLNKYNLTKYIIELSNDGVGPAIIKNVYITFDGEPVNSWWALFDKFNLPDSVNTLINNNTFSKKVIKAGGTLKIIDLNDNLSLANYFSKNSNKIIINIYYESIYGEKWLHKWNTSGIDETTKIETPYYIPENQRFKN